MSHHRIKTDIPCLQCGGTVLATAYQIKTGIGKFCSRKCKEAWEVRPERIRERFWSYVDKKGPIPPHRPELGHCWVWTRGKTTDGYGQFRDSGKGVLTHRWVWKQAHGPIGKNLQILHHCDNPSCVRLSHLFIGTELDNIADKMAKKRNCKGERINTAKLTSEQVMEIRRRYIPPTKGNLQELIAEFGVTEKTIRRIIRHLNWTHLPRA